VRFDFDRHQLPSPWNKSVGPPPEADSRILKSGNTKNGNVHVKEGFDSICVDRFRGREDSTLELPSRFNQLHAEVVDCVRDGELA
jgi:hypothetical protein